MEKFSTLIPHDILGKKNKEYSLPLIYHLLDVACVGAYLWDSWLCKEVKEQIEFCLPEARSLLLLACYIHDIGKCSDFFQKQLDGEKVTGWKDHVTVTNSMLAYYLLEKNTDKYRSLAKSFVRELISYHHGIQSTRDTEQKLWDNFISFDQISSYIDTVLKHLGLTKDCFFTKYTDIPFSIRDILSGLLIMADWIGSNDNIFYYYKDHVPNYELRKNSALGDIKNLLGGTEYKQFANHTDFFTSVFGFNPNALQQAVGSVNVEEKKLVFVEAPTGHGKTEAALSLVYRYLNSPSCYDRGIYIAMPTCATSNALYYRINNFIQSICINPDFCKLHHSKANLFFYNKNNKVDVDNENNSDEIVMENKRDDLKDSVFKYKLTNARKYIIGTVDHILKMCMNVKHFTMHHACLVNHIIVFDEVHSYDARMFSCLCASLAFLSKYNVPVIILSATMPEDKRQKLMEAYGKDKSLCLNAYPKSEHIIDDPTVIRVGEKENHKYVHFDLSTQTEFHPSDEYEKDANAVINKIKQLGCNGYYGVVVNTVERSQNFSEIFIKEFGKENVILLHSRMTSEHRSKVEKQVLSIVGKDKDTKGVPKDRKSGKYFKVIIATQIVEQSIDIDFDCLFTDLCPMDALVQRVGRLHRHSQNNPYRPEALREEWCFVLQAYSNSDVIHNDMVSYCEEKLLTKDDIKTFIDKYSKLVYDSYLLYSTYSELLSLKDGVMDTITQTEEKVKSVYGDGSSKTLYGVSLKDFYLSYKGKIDAIAEDTYRDMFPILGRAVSHNIEDFRDNSEECYLYQNGLNEKTDADVRDTRASLEVVLLNKYSDNSGVCYTSCYDDHTVDVRNWNELEFHTINLPTKVIHKCGGKKELRDKLKNFKPEGSFLNHTEFLVFENETPQTLEGVSVTLWYDKEKGLMVG